MPILSKRMKQPHRRNTHARKRPQTGLCWIRAIWIQRRISANSNQDDNDAHNEARFLPDQAEKIESVRFFRQEAQLRLYAAERAFPCQLPGANRHFALYDMVAVGAGGAFRIKEGIKPLLLNVRQEKIPRSNRQHRKAARRASNLPPVDPCHKQHNYKNKAEDQRRIQTSGCNKISPTGTARCSRSQKHVFNIVHIAVYIVQMLCKCENKEDLYKLRRLQANAADADPALCAG